MSNTLSSRTHPFLFSLLGITTLLAALFVVVEASEGEQGAGGVGMELARGSAPALEILKTENGGTQGEAALRAGAVGDEALNDDKTGGAREKEDDKGDKGDKDDKDDKDDEDVKAGGEGADTSPAAPVPTPEEVKAREERSRDFQTLGEKFFKFPVSGVYTARYLFRKGDGDSDQEVYQYASVDIGDKARHLATGHVAGRFSADLDGRRTGTRADLFSDVLDTYHSPVNLRLYSAYTDFHKIPGLDFLRAGRQWNYETPEIVPFDGLRVDTAGLLGRHALKFSFFGGVPVHEFEASAAGDWVAGAAVEGRPWKSTRMRLDWMRAADELSLQREQNNNLLSLSVWQRFVNPQVRLHGRFTMLDDSPRDGMLRAVYYKKDLDLQVSATYQGWFENQRKLVTEFDRYFDTLRGQEPYHNMSLVVTKGWTEHLWVEAGATLRRLTGGAKEGDFNREFDRYHLTVEVRDLPAKGFTASVTGYWWEGTSQAADTHALAGDLTYEWSKQNRTSVGTDYSLYKYDFFSNQERDHVRGVYFKHRYKPTPWTTLRFEYDYEKSLSEEFHTAKAVFQLDF